MKIDYGYNLVAFINSFIFMSALTNPLIFPIRNKFKLIAVFYIFLCQIILGPIFGQTIIAITIIGSLLIIHFTSGRSPINTIFSLIGYLFAVIMNYAIFVPLSLLGITVDEINSGIYSILTIVVYGILTFASTYYLGIFLRRKILRIQHVFSKKLNLLIALELITCFIIFAVNIVQEERAGYPAEVIYFNIVLFSAFFGITLVIFFFCLSILMKNHELLQLQQEKKNLSEYMDKLEDLYDNLRTFKHDYINILSTLQCYIMETNSTDLKNYFNDTIMPSKNRLTDKDQMIGRLSNIKVLEIKGIVYSKLIVAMNLGLDIRLEVRDEVTSFSMEMLDLSRIIGIFIDNAIEAAYFSQARTLIIAIIDNPGSVTFIISNSTADSEYPMTDIYKKSFTTKYGHTGLGLHNVAQILSDYKNVLHSTTFKNLMFTQTLEICHKDKRDSQRKLR